MNRYTELGITPGNAICYSGYRHGQSPDTDTHPSYEQVKQDLMILHGRWAYLRLYDCNAHAETVLEVIRREKFNFKVMLGAWLGAEMNNFGCPWGGIYTDSILEANRRNNLAGIKKLAIVCPAFVSDCLETLEEISVEGKEQFEHGGGENFHYIPCLNDEDRWIEVVKTLCEEKLEEFYLV